VTVSTHVTILMCYSWSSSVYLGCGRQVTTLVSFSRLMWKILHSWEADSWPVNCPLMMVWRLSVLNVS